MTRVLLVAPKSDFTDQLIRAFGDEGHQLQWIDERGLRIWPPLWRLVRHIRPLRRLSNRLLGRHIVGQASRWRPDLVLVCKGTTVKEPALRTLRGMGIRLANWFPENGRNEPYRSWLDRHIGLYDHFFSFDSGILERQRDFPRTRIGWLPLGVDPDAFTTGPLTADDHARYDCDVCFVGARYPERERMLAMLTDFKLKIFGWKDWEHSPLASHYHGPLDAAGSAKAYRCAAVVLNMNLEPPVNGVNAKTFEICAAGGFQLTDFRTDLPRLFTEGQELAVFKSIGELKEKIEYYLAHPDERGEIARVGRERVLREHTLRHRVRTIISAVT